MTPIQKLLSKIRTAIQCSMTTLTVSAVCIVITAIACNKIAVDVIDDIYVQNALEIEQVESRYINEVIPRKDDEIDALCEQINTLNNEINTLNLAMTELTAEYQNRIDALNMIIAEYEYDDICDFEYIRKYSYVIVESPKNSGLTIDVIRYMDEQCKRWDIPVTMMWGIAFTESRYNTRAFNSSSSATGLGQVLPSTGKGFWERVLGYGSGSFTSDMLYNPYVNIEIMCAHIGVSKQNGESLYKAIDQYSGGGSDYYYKILQEYCSNHGFTLDGTTFYYGADM